MAEIDLGPVEGPKGTSMRFRGDWNGIAEYRNDEMFVDCVAYDNGLWICKATCSAQMPADGSEYWSFACAGIAGPQGDRGDPTSLEDLGITVSVEEINNSGGSTGNIQEQINGLQTSVDTIDTKLNGLLKVVTVTGPSTTIAAGAATAVTFTYSVPSGYTEVGVIGFYAGSTSLVPILVRANRMDLRNVSTTSITTAAMTITILFAQTGTL